MKYRLSKLICFCLVGMMASCGLIDMEFDPETQQIVSMQFNYDTVYVMKGDTFFLAPYIYPDTVSNTTLYLYSTNEQVVGVQNDTIYAADEGETLVVAVSVSHAISDSCVYAHILSGGMAPAGKMLFGAFSDDEPRGLAEPMNEERTLYRFRVWSDDFYVSQGRPGEEITFRAYNPRTLQVQETMTPFSIPFDGESHGTPSKPIELRFE